MTHSSIIFKTFISPTPVFDPTILPNVHGIPGIVGVILQPRHECTGLQRACNGCNRYRRIPSSNPPPHCLSSPLSADLREAMAPERRLIWTRSHPSVTAVAVWQQGCRDSVEKNRHVDEITQSGEHRISGEGKSRTEGKGNPEDLLDQGWISPRRMA